MAKQIPINGQIPEPEEFSIPPVSLIVTTYELAEEPPGRYFWKATVSHIFNGETVERVHQLSESHKETDAFYKASFEGRFPWRGGTIILKNSEFQIIQ